MSHENVGEHKALNKSNSGISQLHSVLVRIAHHAAACSMSEIYCAGAVYRRSCDMLCRRTRRGRGWLTISTHTCGFS